MLEGKVSGNPLPTAQKRELRGSKGGEPDALGAMSGHSPGIWL